MKVLVSNDDGIFAPGVDTLVSVLKEFAQVIVVCPESQKSGFGHSITVSKPIRPRKVNLMEGVEAYQVDASPADCIKIALEVLCDSKPDLIISGMNAGANVGQDIYYSGTIGAAREAALYGIGAMAFSLGRNAQEKLDFVSSKKILHMLFDKLLSLQIPPYHFLNVNIPAMDLATMRGVKVVQPEVTNKKFDYMSIKDPKSNQAYWLSNRYLRMDAMDIETDYQALKDGFVTISALDARVTEPAFTDVIKNIFK